MFTHQTFILCGNIELSGNINYIFPFQILYQERIYKLIRDQLADINPVVYTGENNKEEIDNIRREALQIITQRMQLKQPCAQEIILLIKNAIQQCSDFYLRNQLEIIQDELGGLLIGEQKQMNSVAPKKQFDLKKTIRNDQMQQIQLSLHPQQSISGQQIDLIKQNNQQLKNQQKQLLTEQPKENTAIQVDEQQLLIKLAEQAEYIKSLQLQLKQKDITIQQQEENMNNNEMQRQQQIKQLQFQQEQYIAEISSLKAEILLLQNGKKDLEIENMQIRSNFEKLQNETQKINENRITVSKEQQSNKIEDTQVENQAVEQNVEKKVEKVQVDIKKQEKPKIKIVVHNNTKDVKNTYQIQKFQELPKHESVKQLPINLQQSKQQKLKEIKLISNVPAQFSSVQLENMQNISAEEFISRITAVTQNINQHESITGILLYPTLQNVFKKIAEGAHSAEMQRLNQEASETIATLFGEGKEGLALFCQRLQITFDESDEFITCFKNFVLLQSYDFLNELLGFLREMVPEAAGTEMELFGVKMSAQEMLTVREFFVWVGTQWDYWNMV